MTRFGSPSAGAGAAGMSASGPETRERAEKSGLPTYHSEFRGSVTNAEELRFERARLVADLSDIAYLYWLTDIPVKEIAEAYMLRHQHIVRELAGPAVFEDFKCDVCGGQVYAFSRTERFERCEGKFPNNETCNECLQLRLRAQRERAVYDSLQRSRLSKSLRNMPYLDYLRTPEWQTIRKEALARAGYRCQVCSSGERLNVHHRTYVRRGCERPSDLTVLCEGCHTIFHQGGKLAEGGVAA